jgi:hypothetical protein
MPDWNNGRTRKIECIEWYRDTPSSRYRESAVKPKVQPGLLFATNEERDKAYELIRESKIGID